MYDRNFNSEGESSHRSYGHDSEHKGFGQEKYGHDNAHRSYGHDSDHRDYNHDNDHKGYGHGSYKGSGRFGEKKNFGSSRDRRDFDKKKSASSFYNEKVSPIKLGKSQKLYIQRFADFGAYLGTTPDRISREEREASPKGSIVEVLLPKRELGEDARIGDSVEVFVYLDSSDRPIASLVIPPLSEGTFAPLKVKEVSKFGAFLDWGLPKDLFLPFREMKEQPKEGDEILVRLYIDKTGRLAASEKDIYKLLSSDSPYKKDDDVEGRVYELGVDFGIFVAVDDKYSAMIPKSEKHDELHIGDKIHARVMDVKEDGKLDISLREKAYAEIDTDAEALYQLLDEYGGVFPFTEKATPAVIERETGLSKAAFKRAIGRLYKERKITLNNGVIRRAE